DRVGRIHERLARHSRRAGALVRINAVDDTEIQRTSQRRLNGVQNLLKHTKLVILIRPLKLVSDANGLLELERLEGLHPRGEVHRRLILTLTNILGLTRGENNSLALPELQRNLARERRNNRRHPAVRQTRSRIVSRDTHIA